ncbi:MAG: alcohol dehydrogenase catalytic domain-containing protein [Spirochaetes bacterium]|nr:alcohol dehydrogenase catalytic domain-containing protein [Spirochaetota bacterium]
MKAYLFKNGSICVIEKEIPAISKNEALIKIKLSGICNTDIELLKGYYNFTGIPGHEFVGIVEDSYNTKLLGKRVVGEINISCGKCNLCLSGSSKHCPNRKVLGILGWDGSFSEYIKLPVNNLHIVDDSISDEEAVFTEPLAAALEPSQQFLINQNTAVAVLGDGKLGLLSAIGLKCFSSNLTLVGKHENKLDIARKQNVNAILPDSLEMQLKSGEIKRFDIVIEATGSETGLGFALNMVKPGGIIVIKTTISKSIPVDISRITVNEINIIGSRCGNFNQALYFLKNKMVNVNDMVSNVFSFDNFIEAMQNAQRRGSLKYIIKY